MHTKADKSWGQMTVGQHLAVPYIRSVQTIAVDSHEWSRSFEYPEIPGCVVQARATLLGLAALEFSRVSILLHLLGSGLMPTPPRLPLRGFDVRGDLLDKRIDIPASVLNLSELQAQTSGEVLDISKRLAQLSELTSTDSPWPYDGGNGIDLANVPNGVSAGSVRNSV